MKIYEGTMTRFLYLLQFLIFTFKATFSQVIHVPDDYSSIQAAINASDKGDTVLVEDGTYVERINFKGKAITVASMFIIDGDNTHIDSTIINASWTIVPDSGSVVTFNSGEDTTSVLCGFTITGGTGTINPPNIDLPSLSGGGIFIYNSGAKIENNIITGNNVHDYVAVGGGIVIITASTRVLIKNNTIKNNTVTCSIQGAGGGIMCYYTPSNLIEISENIVSENSVLNSSEELFGNGGGICLYGSIAFIRNNLIKNNKAQLGGGIDVSGYPGSDIPNVVNNTIVYNEASISGGGLAGSVLPMIVKNSIFRGNTAPQDDQIGSNDAVEYSLVEGGFDGTGNIDQDPHFADTTSFYLSATSPCIDAGNPHEIYFDNEDQTNPGYALYPAMGNLRNDIGHCGGNPDMLKNITSVTYEDNPLPDEFVLYQNYPNPFNPATTIKYSIPAYSKQYSVNSSQNPASSIQNQVPVSLKVYDVLGKEVATLVNDYQRPGSYQVKFDASGFASGVYFYKLTAGKYIVTKKMLLLR
jgi:hypothetical protein